MIVTQAINVHLDKQSNPAIETVQSDTGRAVTAALFNQGAPWEPPAGAIGMVRHSILHEGEVYTSAYDTLSDGTAAVSFSGNQLTVHLCPEILSIPGVGELQVGIHHNRVLVATMTVLLRVQRNVGTQGLSPTAYTDLSHHIQNELARQFRNVYDQGSWLENLHHRVNVDYAMGGIAGNGSQDLTQKNRISSDMILHWGREVRVSFPAGVKVRCLFYDAQSNCCAETLFFEESFTCYSPQPYLRLEAGYADDGTVQDLEKLACQIGVFYSSSFRGHIGAMELTAFGECTDAGYYQFSKEELANLSDAPDITTGGILEVIPHADTDVTFQTLWTPEGQIWFRKGSDAFRQVNAPAAFIVTVDTDGNTDKTFQELQAAWEQGRYCLCNLDDFLIPLVQMESSAHFAGVWHGREYRVEIAADDVTVEATELGGGGVFTVTYTDNEDEYQRIDKTFEEIRAAVESGMVVQCLWYDEVLPLSRITGYSFEFDALHSTHNVFVRVEQNGSASGTWIDRLNPIRRIHLSKSDGCVLLDSGATNHELITIQDHAEGTVPYVTLDDYDSDRFHIHLPYAESTVIDKGDGTAYDAFVFSQILYPGEDGGKTVRYTVKLIADYSDPDGEPTAEVLVEDVQSGSGLTTEQITALDGMFRIAAYTADATDAYVAFRQAFGLDGVDVPEVPVEPEVPDVISVRYELPEATTFDGTNYIDTGVMLLDEGRDWTICLDYTPTAKEGRPFDISGNRTGGVYLGLRGGYGWNIYCAGNLAEISTKIENMKVVITHVKGADSMNVTWVTDSATLSTYSFVYDEKNINIRTAKNIILGADYTKEQDFAKGTLHRFVVYNGVLSEAAIHDFLGVSE